jgi:hypothetical protein
VQRGGRRGIERRLGPLRALSLRLTVAVAAIAHPVAAAGCCVNPFIGTDTHIDPNAPGSPSRETGGSLEEHAPALQERSGAAGLEAGFDMRLVRVQPGVHLGTEQTCDVAAAGRLEPIELTEEEAEASRYSEGATQRMSIQCAAPTGASWADLAFNVTSASHAPDVQVGVRIRVRIVSAEGGFFDYPIVDYVATLGRAPEGTTQSRSPGSSSAPPQAGFDLRQIHTDPALVGSAQQCAISHVGDIDILDASDVRRRSYPAGVQNRMTVRCRHGSGDEWADLVFMPAQARSALHVRRGDLVPVLVVSRNGGFFEYPVLQFAGE